MTKKKEPKKDDGWIAAFVDWAARTYGWGFDEIMWEVPASAIALLRRQEWKKDDGTFAIFPLSVIEEEDDGN